LLRAAHYLTSSGDAAASLALLDTMPAPAAAALRQREAVLRMGALHQLGRLDEAHAAGQQALAWAAPDSRARAEVLATLSTLSHSRGRTREAVAQADAGLSIYTRLGDTIGRARTLFYRGAFSVELGDNTRAEADMRASATLAGQHGNTYLQRMVLYNLASIYSNQSRPGQALAVANEAWPTLAGTPREEIALMFRSMFIECHFQRGEWGAMWEHLEPAAGDVLARAQLLTMLGVANCALEPAAMLGRWDCVAPLVQALEDAKALDDVPVAAEVSLGCAYAALVRGEPDAAAGWLQRVQAAGEAEHPRVRCRALLLRAELAVLGGAGVQALAGIPTDDAAGMNPELRLRALTTRWRAGGLPREDALAALDDPGAHAGAALLLAHALGGEAYRTRRQRLAESLVALPDVQMRFLAAWR
jgi:hypothetical protein